VRANGGAIDRQLSYFLVCKDPERAVMHKNHPLAALGAVSIQEFANWPVIGLSRQTWPLASRTSIRTLERHGVDFKLTGEYPNLESCLFNLEFNERAVMLVPDHMVGMLGPNCVARPLEETDCWLNVEMLWNPRSTNPSTKIFIEEFKKFSESSNWLNGTCGDDTEGSHEFA
jgi:DNA-binding transcriptional LysR family regulator